MGRSLITALLCSLLASGVSAARTWVVLPDGTGDAPTIQAGIDSASAGDTVFVDCGTYYEYDIQVKSGICLTSATGTPECVTIDARDLGRVMSCEFVDSTTSIVGMTLTNGHVGYDTGGGLYCYRSDVKVTNCVITGCVAHSGGGGVETNRSSPVFTDCEFSYNSSSDYYAAGAGVFSYGGSPRFIDCVFSNNGSMVCHGGGFGGNGTQVTFVRCLFYGNEGIGGGLKFDGGSAVLSACTIATNSAGAGGAGGIQFGNPTDAALTNCIIAFNTAGAAVEWDAVEPEPPELTCCDIYCNSHGDWTEPIADQWGVNGNMSKDPLFCDAATFDFSLCMSSPCLNDDTCGTIGACAFGCSTCMSEAEWEDVTTTPLGDNGKAAGLAWVDYDVDGDLDIFLTNRASENVLLRNDSLTAEGFVDATPPVLAGSSDSRGCPWGDYDNDGDPDLYVANLGANKLYRNDGNGNFVDVTASPLDDAGTGQSAGWFDFDNDGDLDLYVVNNGANKLFQNDGGGVFTDITSGPLGDTSHGTGLSFADYDNDCDMDIYVSNHSGSNVLMENQGAGVFVDVTTLALACTAPSFGSAWGDYDNDGDLDLYVTNSGANNLLRNDGGAFTDVSAQPVNNPWVGRSASWLDYDNDGDLDIYLVNEGSNVVCRNDGSGSFVKVEGLCQTGIGRSGGWGDFDRDGDLDFYVANYGLNKLFQNKVGSYNHWLEVDPVSVTSNRSGIGVRVRVVVGGVSQMREIPGVSGYASQEPTTAWFGLNTATTVDTVVVTWPGVMSKILTGVACDQTIQVVEDLAGIPDDLPSPDAIRLYAGRPNPFSTETLIRYDLPERSRVDLKVYDASGRLVRTLLEQSSKRPGRHVIRWNGRSSAGERAAPGVYFLELKVEDWTGVERLVLLK